MTTMLKTINFCCFGSLCRFYGLALLWAMLLLPSILSAQPAVGTSATWRRPSGCGLDLEVYCFDSVKSTDCPLRFAKLDGGVSRINPWERSNNGAMLQERIYSERDSAVAGMVIAEGFNGDGLQGRVPDFLVVQGHLFGMGPLPDSAVLLQIRLYSKDTHREGAKDAEATDTLVRIRKGEFQPLAGDRYDRYQEYVIVLPAWWSRAAASLQQRDQAGMTLRWMGGERMALRSMVFRDSLGQVLRSQAPAWRSWREELVSWMESEVRARPKVASGVIVQEILGSPGGGSCDRWTTARWLLEWMVKDVRQLQGLPMEAEVEEEPMWPLLPKGKAK